MKLDTDIEKQSDSDLVSEAINMNKRVVQFKLECKSHRLAFKFWLMLLTLTEL